MKEKKLTSPASRCSFAKRSPSTVLASRVKNVESHYAQEHLFRSDFSAWLESNWHVWLSFEAEAEKAWQLGRRTYSARTLVEYLRHDTNIRQVEREYKINNNFVPDLGRIYGMMHENRADFFECRVMKRPCVRYMIRTGPKPADEAAVE
jgi:hypothetical protein